MMFERAAGVPMKSIPYKGGAPLLQDLMGGQIPVAFNVRQRGAAARARAASCARWRVASPQRWAALPEVPTLAELGYKDIAAVEFLGWYAPAKTPPDFVQASSTPRCRRRCRRPRCRRCSPATACWRCASRPRPSPRCVKDDIARWGPIVKATGFTAGGLMDAARPCA